MDDSENIGPRTNVVLSLLVLAACGLGWLAVDRLPTGLQVDPLGPAYYPRFVLLGLAALSLALLVASLRELRALGRGGDAGTIERPLLLAGASDVVEDLVDEDLPPVWYPRLLAVFGLLLAYVLLLDTLGYFLSTLLFVAVLLLLLRVRGPLIVAACALGTPLVLGGIFGWVLGVPLPDGLVEYLPFELP